MQPLSVTVVVPVYNAMISLRRCVDSVLEQGAFVCCILVDDGSTDGSGQLCDTLAAESDRVQVIHQPNRGVSAARNAALMLVRTPYLAFLDSDDTLLPDALSAALAAQQETPADWVLWQYTTGDSGEHFEGGSISLPPQALAQLYLDCLIAMPWNKLYRTEIAQKLSFDPAKTLGEDLLFCMDYHKAAGCPGFRLIRQPLTFYDCTTNSGQTLSTRYTPDYCPLWVGLFSRFLSDCTALGCPADTLRKVQRAELRVVAEGIADILHRAPGDSKERNTLAGQTIRLPEIRRITEEMKRQKNYSPYYWPMRLSNPVLVRRMADWKVASSPWFGRFDWLGWYLLGGKWARD